MYTYDGWLLVIVFGSALVDKYPSRFAAQFTVLWYIRVYPRRARYLRSQRVDLKRIVNSSY